VYTSLLPTDILLFCIKQNIIREMGYGQIRRWRSRHTPFYPPGWIIGVASTYTDTIAERFLDIIDNKELVEDIMPLMPVDTEYPSLPNLVVPADLVGAVRDLNLGIEVSTERSDVWDIT
jgi:hypothetical protein